MLVLTFAVIVQAGRKKLKISQYIPQIILFKFFFLTKFSVIVHHRVIIHHAHQNAYKTLNAHPWAENAVQTYVTIGRALSLSKEPALISTRAVSTLHKNTLNLF